MPYRTRITQTYIDMRTINLGAELIGKYQLPSKQKYSIRILGDTTFEARGTLNQSNALSGLSILYRNYDLQIGDEIELDYDGSHVLITPPAGKKRGVIAPAVPIQPATTPVPPSQPSAPTANIFTKKNLRHIHIEPFAEKNFREWTPKTEADVYLVFGTVSEFTDYKYCCGASADLLKRLGYSAGTKPDAILIDRATDEYLVAEFKMWSSEFRSNHLKDDIDVLIYWIDDEKDRSILPDEVLGLSTLIERGIKDGDIEL